MQTAMFLFNAAAADAATTADDDAKVVREKGSACTALTALEVRGFSSAYPPSACLVSPIAFSQKVRLSFSRDRIVIFCMMLFCILVFREHPRCSPADPVASASHGLRLIHFLCILSLLEETS